MMTSREQRVRMLAYRLWESEGRPDGQEARHWEMAERIVEAENAREEEQEWQPTADEPSPLEGEDPTAEPDELGIDEMRLPLDDPETEARKEEDTGVEVHLRAEDAEKKAAPRKRATPKKTASTDASARRGATKRKTTGDADVASGARKSRSAGGAKRGEINKDNGDDPRTDKNP